MPKHDDGGFDDEERPTGVLCLACAGDKMIQVLPGQFKKCAWCGGTGAMSMEQLKLWKSRLVPR